MDNPPVYIEVQGSKVSDGSAENHDDGLNARNVNKSPVTNADLNDAEDNAEKHEQSFK